MPMKRGFSLNFTSAFVRFIIFYISNPWDSLSVSRYNHADIPVDRQKHDIPVSRSYSCFNDLRLLHFNAWSAWFVPFLLYGRFILTAMRPVYSYDFSGLVRVRFWDVQLMLCRSLTCQVCCVYGYDVSSWCFVDIWFFEFLGCTVLMCRIDAV